MKLLIMTILLVSNSALAFNDAQLKSLMHSYLQALKTSDKKVLKEITNEKYYKMLEEHGTLKTIKEKNRNIANSKTKITFDLKTRTSLSKNQIYVSIKDVKAKEYGHHWYLIKRKNNKLLISDMISDD